MRASLPGSRGRDGGAPLRRAGEPRAQVQHPGGTRTDPPAASRRAGGFCSHYQVMVRIGQDGKTDRAGRKRGAPEECGGTAAYRAGVRAPPPLVWGSGDEQVG
jgi:hypothetical protein